MFESDDDDDFEITEVLPDREIETNSHGIANVRGLDKSTKYSLFELGNGVFYMCPVNSEHGGLHTVAIQIEEEEDIIEGELH